MMRSPVGLLATAAAAILLAESCGGSRVHGSAPSPSATSSASVDFTDPNLGVRFSYPSSWGTVIVSAEDARCFVAGEGHTFKFSGNLAVGATLRSRNFLRSPSCARGGAYFDSAALFANATSVTNQPWDPSTGDVFRVIERSGSRIVDAQCSGILNFVGMDGWVRLGGNKFDVIHIYQQLRQPRPDGAGVDATGCQNPDALFAPIRAVFIAFVHSTGPAAD